MFQPTLISALSIVHISTACTSFHHDDNPLGSLLKDGGSPTSIPQSQSIMVLELDFDDTFVKPLHWSSISQAYIRVLHAQDFPRTMAMDVYCFVYLNVKSLEHIHT